MEQKIKNKHKHIWESVEGVDWCSVCGTIRLERHRTGGKHHIYRRPSAQTAIETKLRKERLCAICESAINGGTLY